MLMAIKGYLMNRATKVVCGILIFGAIGYVASFFVPIPASWTGDSVNFHWTLANSVLYTLLHIGAAILLLIGVTAYKAALRAAYARIALGIVLVGAGLAQVVMLNIFGLIQTPWVQYGGVMLPFVVAGISIYSGVRSMAKLIHVASPLARLSVVIPLLLVSLTVVALLPHSSSPLPELYFDISNAISVWDVVLYAASFGLVLHIKNHSGAYYTESMAWLAVGLMGSVVITCIVLLTTFITGQESSGYLVDSIVIIGGILYLKAGHSFAKTKEL